MKRYVASITAALLSCVAVAVFFSACENKKDDGKAPSEILLNSFESYSDMHDFYYSGEFRFECVSEHVSEGEKAALFTVGEDKKETKSSNTFGVPLYNLEGTKNYRDFSRLSKITFDVFNASETPVTISTSVLQKKLGLMYSNVQSVIVEAGKASVVEYNVNKYEIFYSLGIDGPTHINVMVSGVNPKVYFDNMVLKYQGESFTVPDMEYAENEILSFEHAYQSFVTYTTGTVLKSEIVSDPENASEGLRYARVYREGVADGTVFWGGKFGISAKYMGEMNFQGYSENSYIAFDYKTEWNGSNMWIVPRLVSTSTNAYANIKNLSLPCDNQWHTVCIPFDFAPVYFDNIELSFDGGTYGDVYLDNFRIAEELPDGAIVATDWGTT